MNTAKLTTDGTHQIVILPEDFQLTGTEVYIIGAMDMLIAAHVLSLGVTLVTNNIREFSRIPSLSLENWVE